MAIFAQLPAAFRSASGPVLGCLFVASAAAGCGRLPSTNEGVYPTDAAESIARARAAQNDAIGAMDWDAVASYWTEDVTIRAGLGLAISGRWAYREAFRQAASMRYVRTTESVRVSTEWPLAWETGTWIGRERQTGATLISGTYSAQWLRGNDRRWRIRSELFVALDCAGRGCDLPVARPVGGG